MQSEKVKKSGNQNSQQYTSAFKTLLVKFLEANGEMSKMPAKFRSTIKCYVKESHPNFLITDGVFFIAGHFTKEALESYKAKNTAALEKLKGFLIDITKWSLELALVDSTKSFTSYANLELRLVINEFNLASDTVQELENKHPTNLFRDDECRAFIQNFLFTQQQSILKNRLPEFDLGSNQTASFSIDSVETQGDFQDYPFLKRTETEKVVQGKVEVVKKKGKQAKKQTEGEDEDLEAIPKSKVAIKQKTTVNVKKAAVTTEIVKQQPKNTATTPRKSERIANIRNKTPTKASVLKETVKINSSVSKKTISETPKPKKREIKAAQKKPAVAVKQSAPVMKKAKK